jgi:hypothetical protein
MASAPIRVMARRATTQFVLKVSISATWVPLPMPLSQQLLRHPSGCRVCLCVRHLLGGVTINTRSANSRVARCNAAGIVGRIRYRESAGSLSLYPPRAMTLGHSADGAAPQSERLAADGEQGSVGIPHSGPSRAQSRRGSCRGMQPGAPIRFRSLAPLGASCRGSPRSPHDAAGASAAWAIAVDARSAT